SYEAALELFRERPLIGAGHGAMERIAGAEDHRLAWAGNLEIHLLADTGLAGTLAFLGFLGASVGAVWRAHARARGGDEKRRHLERLGALLVLLVCAQATETSWLASFWVLFGLALAAARARPEADTVP